ncbi:polyadenylate-binding protein RBP45B-like isoform X1 [Hibiscus syriacus]|uniref:polyadenylate-binding protein RBP45B-like isoform X1 n=1 Tax=Hibiscus syriacus TaxID=106335 RepID=UPI0019225F4B|nr:polyadenylate-binding protein RBP45B-like isoform X1 [Hibiscus syriacus]
MMQQPAPGMVPPPMAPPPSMAGAPPAQQQYQYQQPPPAPQSQQPYIYMMPHQSHPPPMWPAQQGSAGVPAQQPAAGQSGQPASADEVRTLWIGDLQYYMDENYLLSCFAQTGEVASVKVIRNKQTGQVEGYGFIEFVSRAAAERVLQTYNGTPMPNGESNYRLNWASFSSGEKREESPEFTIFVGDLAADVTDYMLQETFRAHFQSVKGAKVVIDRATGRTKGYGFVRFGDETEYNRAMSEMNGAFCSTRPMRIGPATNKKIGAAQQYPTAASSQGNQNENDPNNTTIFVGNLDSDVTEDHLREVFSPYGQLVHVKIPQNKRCGFVQYADRSCAEEALRILNGTQLGGQSIRLSWGRSTSNKQAQPDPNQWNSGYYGYGQGYGYGYAAAHQDPNMYYGGYPGYGNYQQPQQQQQQVGYS